MEQQFNHNQMVSSLMKIGHGKLDLYIKDILPIAKLDPNLFSHFVIWNNEKGKVRDSKCAFPIIGLRGLNKTHSEFAESNIASLMTLSPREVIKAYNFSKEMTSQGLNIPHGYRKLLQFSIQKYLQIREESIDWWNRAVLSNRKAMIALYTISHKKPSKRAQKILFLKQYPQSSVFQIIKDLKFMQPLEAAGNILKYKIPMQIAIGSVSSIKNNDILLALIEGMTGNELINNTDMLKRLGVLQNDVLKSAYDKAIEKAKSDKKVNVYKTQKAKEKITDKKLITKLDKIEKEQIKSLGNIEGDWLILGDRSGSMSSTIELAKEVAATITERVKNNVYLVFFDSIPEMYDVSGKTLSEIKELTRNVHSRGSTSIGCGLELIMSKDIIINGIAIISDGEENSSPRFDNVYKRYCSNLNIEPTVYLYHVGGRNQLTENYITIFNIQNVDYYSLPNLVLTMRTSKYSLLDEIMQTELLTFDKVFNQKGEKYDLPN